MTGVSPLMNSSPSRSSSRIIAQPISRPEYSSMCLRRMGTCHRSASKRARGASQVEQGRQAAPLQKYSEIAI